jgi:hypothetical protein
MVPNYIIILGALIVAACDKPSACSLLSENFTLPDGPGDLSDYVSGLAVGGLADAAIRKQREENLRYPPWAPLHRRDHPGLSDDQWIRLCFEKIFQRLGFPFESMPGSGVRFDTSTQTYTVIHSAEALAAHQIFLDDHNRSPLERWKDLLKGGEPQGEQGVAPQSATRSESGSEGGHKPQPESEERPR